MVGSISKTPVSFDVAAAIVDDAFGAGTALVDLTELTEGWFNAAYVLTLDDGTRCVLKVAPPPDVAVLTYEHDIMAAEVSALRLVGERTSTPVPRVLWSDDSCRRAPSALFVMEHCPGVLLHALRPSLELAQQQHVDAQIARYLREMNGITHEAFGFHASSARRFTSWSEAFVQMVDDVLADGERVAVVLPVAYDVLRRLVRDHVDALDAVTVPCFVHWDLWDANVLVDPGTLEVLGIIDFERALWGDPLMEGQFFSKRDDPAFLDAYGVAMLDDEGARRRRLLYDLYLFLVMVIEVAYRHYPTDDIEQFGRMRLDQTLERLGFGSARVRYGAAMTVDARLAELGIELPDPFPPAGNYVAAVRTGALLFLSGAGPIRADGSIVTGKVGGDVDLPTAVEAARLTGLQLLASIRREVGSLDRVVRVVKTFGMVNCAPGFNRTPQVIDGCSNLLVEVLGEAGRGARSAVGMAELPFDIAVEIELVVEVSD